MKKQDVRLLVAECKWYVTTERGSSVEATGAHIAEITQALENAHNIIEMEWNGLPFSIKKAGMQTLISAGYADKGAPGCFLADKNGTFFAALAIFEPEENQKREACVTFKKNFSTMGF